MTEIIVFRRGKIVFRSVEPRLMTGAEVEKELARWRVSRDGCDVFVNYDSKYGA